MANLLAKVAAAQATETDQDNPSSAVQEPVEEQDNLDSETEEEELDSEQPSDSDESSEQPDLFSDMDLPDDADVADVKKQMEKRFYKELQKQTDITKSLAEEKDKLLGKINDPQEIEGIRAYHKARNPDQASNEVVNPYGEIKIAEEEGDGGWDKDALGASKAAAFDVIKGDFLPAVMQKFQQMEKVLTTLLEREQTRETKRALKSFEGIDGVDPEKVQQFAVEKSLTLDQAAMALYGSSVVQHAKQAKKKPAVRKPKQPAMNGGLPSQFKPGGKNFAQALEGKLDEMLKKHKYLR